MENDIMCSNSLTCRNCCLEQHPNELYGCYDQKLLERFFVDLVKKNETKQFDIRGLQNAEWEKRDKYMNLKLSDDGDGNSISKFDLELDFTKDLIDLPIFQSCIEACKSANMACAISAMCRGSQVNFTEHRMALHCALRDTSNPPLLNAKNLLQINSNVKNVLDRLTKFVFEVRSGKCGSVFGSQRQKFEYIVSIGIGGSDLGSKMVCRALEPWREGGSSIKKCLFVSNVDPTDIFTVLNQVKLEKTLFIVCSKTFTTRETLMNAKLAKAKIMEHYREKMQKEAIGDDLLDQAIGSHFCAVSTNLEETRKFGIADDRVFEFWDWVGGRFSLWSSIGLPIMLYLGMDNFKELSKGANCIDRHFFCTEDLSKNMPVIMGIMKIFYLNTLGLQSHAILPYDENLFHLPSFLQQLEMESNGKSFKKDGTKSQLNASSVVFGQPGTNGQHAFYQMLHQGHTKVPSTFLIASNPSLEAIEANKSSSHQIREHHTCLIANCIAQTKALTFGRDQEKSNSDDKIEIHKTFEGNRPSTMLRYKSLTPFTLGAIIALFEHSTFVAGLIAGINSFDQFGVELGKILSLEIEKDLRGMADGKQMSKHDPSTEHCIKFNLK